MTDIAAAGASAASSQTAARTSVAGNYEMFLTLLTEQLKNQDPLDPLDSNEYVSQLVEFSNVEQSIRQTETLESLLANQVGSSGAAAVAYIGRDAEIDGATAPLQDGEARWRYTLPDQAQSVSIAILNEAGKEVFKTSGDPAPGAHDFVWNGKDAAGADAPAGSYTLSVGVVSGTEATIEPDIIAFGRVTGVNLAGANPTVTLNDLNVSIDQIRAVSSGY